MVYWEYESQNWRPIFCDFLELTRLLSVATWCMLARSSFSFWSSLPLVQTKRSYRRNDENFRILRMFVLVCSEKKFSVRHENQHKSSECCSFFHSNRNDRRNGKNACIFLLALHIFVCVSFICRSVCVWESSYVHRSFGRFVVSFFFVQFCSVLLYNLIVLFL